MCCLYMQPSGKLCLETSLSKKMSEKIIFYPRLYQDYAKTKNLVGRIGRYVLFMHATLRKIMFGNVFVKKNGQNAHRKPPNSPFYTVTFKWTILFFKIYVTKITAAQILRTKFLEIILLTLVKSKETNILREFFFVSGSEPRSL